MTGKGAKSVFFLYKIFSQQCSLSFSPAINSNFSFILLLILYISRHNFLIAIIVPKPNSNVSRHLLPETGCCGMLIDITRREKLRVLTSRSEASNGAPRSFAIQTPRWQLNVTGGPSLFPLQIPNADRKERGLIETRNRLRRLHNCCCFAYNEVAR